MAALPKIADDLCPWASSASSIETCVLCWAHKGRAQLGVIHMPGAAPSLPIATIERARSCRQGLAALSGPFLGASIAVEGLGFSIDVTRVLFI
jgi:hypothetical protein